MRNLALSSLCNVTRNQTDTKLHRSCATTVYKQVRIQLHFTAQTDTAAASTTQQLSRCVYEGVINTPHVKEPRFAHFRVVIVLQIHVI